MKAQEFLDAQGFQVVEEVNCKKVPIDRTELETRLQDLTRVLVTKGRKLLDLDPKKDKDLILDIAIGRSGNLRAPSLRQGNLLVVGFSEAAYQQLSVLIGSV